MIAEEKTLLRIYESNDSFGAIEYTEGMTNSDLMKLCGYLDLLKHRLLSRINDKIEAAR